ncbi:POU domain, class 4, transcription factor 3-like isoform X1 [Haliotis cracherodii]|uniref:POU domain, class 4, transcription factor 3-like isoform X2 n=1 Tax=Haliotis rufescens TaxID=6454 RepID=UPI001EB0828F|nr:POU domain, class 4, transcription factor 3-like isoform X2 [Haliotis rufescens]
MQYVQGREWASARDWGPWIAGGRDWPKQGNFFGGLDDGLLARAEALAAVDIPKCPSAQLMKSDGLYGHTPDLAPHQMTSSRPQMSMHAHTTPFGSGDSMLDQLTGNPPGMTLGPVSMQEHHHHNNHVVSSHSHTHQMYPPVYTHPNSMNTHPGLTSHHAAMHHPVHDTDCDPRELEAFAERFKQRRIKLGVTQADVGSALANLKIPGVGCLSQSTICRFESLTLSHNNMIALKPILQAWLEEAEKAARDRKAEGEMMGGADKKRKRTSIAAPEKRSLEAYFAVQPRPSGEKIAQIAEKLDLKKNVVRVWFCNQRQKQKRMKFSAGGLVHH